LYFRLNVIALHMPALRERTDDIPELAQQILIRIGRRRSQPPMACDPAALEALLRHTWYGNVRELENVLERASAFCEGPVIRVEDLLFLSIRPNDSSPVLPPPPRTLAGKTLDELEKQAILDTLDACGGNKAEAARRLGISEKGLYNKLKRFDLRSDEELVQG